MSESEDLPRFWRNETGTAHIVAEWEESPRANFAFVVTTDCGLEYHTQDTGYDFDPDKRRYEQTNYPHPPEYQCGRCSWPEGDS